MDVIRPASLQDCLRILKTEHTIPVAGGTDLMVNLALNKISPDRIVDISGLQELKEISLSDNFLKIGTLVTFSRLAGREIAQYPFCNALREAAEKMGSPQIRNRATIGGNLVTGSSAGDGSVAILALDAQVELTGLDGIRKVPLSLFYSGYHQTAIHNDELLTAVYIPIRPGTSSFQKVGKRNALAIAVASLAIYSYIRDSHFEQIYIAIGSVAPTPIRAVKTDLFLQGQKITGGVIKEAARIIQDEIAPITDIRGTADYRRKLIANLLADQLQQLSESKN